MLRFDWDEAKAASNLVKHGVSFEEAATVFGDPLALTLDDPDHSADEPRLLAFGVSSRRRLVVGGEYGTWAHAQNYQCP